ncbi:MAG: SgcJ/EcaC family oxidoreductase [Chloroflexota bacterium]
MQRQDAHDADEVAVQSLYRQMLEGWNNKDAGSIASLYEEHANVVGFDGSQINGRAEIESIFGQIFADHVTASYIGIVREVRFITPDVAVLRAVVGMVPPGQSKINPAVNAIQSMVAQRWDSKWRIVLFQTTPAQFHGRPVLTQQLTDELQQLVWSTTGYHAALSTSLPREK